MEDVGREISNIKESKIVLFLFEEDQIIFKDCAGEKVGLQQPTLLTVYSGNYIRCFRKRRHSLPTEGWKT